MLAPTSVLAQQGDTDDSPLIGSDELKFDLTDNPIEEAEVADKKDNLYVPQDEEDDKGNKYIRVEVPIIPKGATENNEEGYYLTGNYATVVNKYSEVQLEINLTLHHENIR